MRKAKLELDRDWGEAAPQTRCCDFPGCAGEGLYRAPRDRTHLTEYLWFCLDHVRAYNSSWNYFAGLSEDEVEAMTRQDTVWQRPSWPFGTRPPRHDQGRAYRVHDPFGIFDDDGPEGGTERRRRPNGAATPEARAFSVMGLEPPVTAAELKARYKELVKRHHPDANGGDKAAEERLKRINEAYTTLKRFFT